MLFNNLWNPSLIVASIEDIKQLPLGVVINPEGEEVIITDKLLTQSIQYLQDKRLNETFATQAWIVVRASELGLGSIEYIYAG